MKTEQLYHFFKDLEDDGVFLCYQGPLWQELLEELNELAKNKIGTHFSQRIMGRYLALFVELVQNIVRYSSTRTIINSGSDISHGIVVIGSQDNRNYILSGNTVDSYHKKVLKEALDRLKDCDKAALNKLFKKQLRDGIHEKSKGAGLGLIDIFRKADRVEYHFMERENQDDFFSIKVEFSAERSIPLGS